MNATFILKWSFGVSKRLTSLARHWIQQFNAQLVKRLLSDFKSAYIFIILQQIKSAIKKWKFGLFFSSRRHNKQELDGGGKRNCQL